jgi:hypothetical protein
LTKEVKEGDLKMFQKKHLSNWPVGTFFNHYRHSLVAGLCAAGLCAQHLLGAPWALASLLAPLPLMALLVMGMADGVPIAVLVASLILFPIMGSLSFLSCALFQLLPLVALSLANLFPSGTSSGERLKEGTCLTETYELKTFYSYLFLWAWFSFATYALMPPVSQLLKTFLEMHQRWSKVYSPGQDLLWVVYFVPAIAGLLWTMILGGQFYIVRKIAQYRYGLVLPKFSATGWRLFTFNYWALVVPMTGVVFAVSTSVMMLSLNMLLIALAPFVVEGGCVLRTLYKTSKRSTLWLFVAVSIFFVWPLALVALLGFFEPWLHVRQRILGFSQKRK